MYGFIRTGASYISSKVADPIYNAGEIIRICNSSLNKPSLIVFPELSLSSAQCGDLFFQDALETKLSKALDMICENTNGIIIVGLPVRAGNALFNCAAVICGGKIAGLVPKFFPSPHERRWFSPGGKYNGDNVKIAGETVPFGKLIFQAGGFNFAVECGSDLLALAPPSNSYAAAGADMICNPFGVAETAGSGERLKELLASHSKRLNSVYILSGSGIEESTNESVFSGRTLIYENGNLLAEGSKYRKDQALALTCAECDCELGRGIRLRRGETPRETDIKFTPLDFVPECNPPFSRKFSRKPFLPPPEESKSHLKDIFGIISTGLYNKLKHTGINKVVLGVSGGLDSTFALLALANCFDFSGISRKNIITLIMPGFGTSGRTKNNADTLVNILGVTSREISIKEACLRHFEDIGLKDGDRGIAYENAQARERTQILMDIANMENALVIGTGDMSELCLGFCTYNGDQMSMYNLNGGIPKTLLPPLLDWAGKNLFPDAAEVLADIAATPVSPELLPPGADGGIIQRTENIIGSYELNDFFMYHMLTYGFTPEKLVFLAEIAFESEYTREKFEDALQKFCKRFTAAQFKRQAGPDSPRVLDLSLSPRSGLLMSCDAGSGLWDSQIE